MNENKAKLEEEKKNIKITRVALWVCSLVLWAFVCYEQAPLLVVIAIIMTLSAVRYSVKAPKKLEDIEYKLGWGGTEHR